MSYTALNVDRLSKRYRIGAKQTRHDTLGATLADLARRPFTNLRALRNLTSFSEQEDGDDIDLGTEGRVVRHQERRDRRDHRRERRRKVHAAEDSRPASRSRPAGRRRGQRSRVEPAGSRHRLSSGSDRPRERLPQWRHSGHDPHRKSTRSSTTSSNSPTWASSSTRR